jgi:hypothetical protein
METSPTHALRGWQGPKGNVVVNVPFALFAFFVESISVMFDDLFDVVNDKGTVSCFQRFHFFSPS